ncbi:MAG: MFS transporter [Chloroflexi bacterium]|nr:MFS transporter [Chloroflexota bacterium]
MNRQLAAGAGIPTIIAGAAGLYLGALDFSINVSLPTMRDSLGESLITVQWIIVIYHASRSGSGFGVGAFGDRFGLKWLFLAGVILNSVAVGLIALQTDLAGIVALRVMQGVGVTILFTVGPALVARAFGPHRRGAALGVTIAAVGAGQVTATLGGGWLVQTIGWEAIFWARVPIGAAVLLIGMFMIQPFVAAATRRSVGAFNWAGAGLLFLALFMFALSVSIARIDGWTSVGTIGTGALFVAFAALFVWRERRIENPLVPGELLRMPAFLAGAASNLVATIAYFLMWFLFPFYVVDTLGRSPVALGAMLATMGASTFVGSTAGGWLADRLGDRVMTVVGAVGTAGGLLWMSQISDTASLPEVALRAGAVGLAFGIHQSSVYALTMRHVSGDRAGAASATLAVTQTIGTVLSVSIGTMIFSWRERLALEEGLSEAGAFIDAYGDAFLAAAGVALIAGVIVIGKRATKGSETGGDEDA